MKKANIHITRLTEADVISTSTAWDIFKKTYSLTTYVDEESGLTGDYSYTPYETGAAVTGTEWNVMEGDQLYNKNGLIATADKDRQKGFLTVGKYYHFATDTDNNGYWFECVDSSHYYQ